MTKKLQRNMANKISIIANDIDESVPGIDKLHGYKKLHTVCDTTKSFFDKKYRSGTDGGEFADDKDMEFSGCLIDNHDYYENGIIDKNKMVETNKKASKNLEEKVSDIIKKGNKPLIIGGSHGTTYNVIKAIKKNIPEDIGLVYFDSHNDCEKSCPIQTNTIRCSWAKDVIDDKLIKPQNMIFVNGQPVSGKSPCTEMGAIQLDKTKAVVTPDIQKEKPQKEKPQKEKPQKEEEYFNKANNAIKGLSNRVKKVYVSYDRDFNKKEGVAIPAYTDQIDTQFELETIKENNIDVIGADIQEYFPPSEKSTVGLFGAYPSTRNDLKHNILELKRYLNKKPLHKT